MNQKPTKPPNHHSYSSIFHASLDHNTNFSTTKPMSMSPFSPTSCLSLLLLIVIALMFFRTCTFNLATNPKIKPFNHDLTLEMPIITTGIGPLTAHYVELRIGEPPQVMYVMLDTGSNATWVYCNHLSYRKSDVLRSTVGDSFGVMESSTFSPILCSSNRSSVARNTCEYAFEYVDGALSAGYWARDTVTLKSSKGRAIKLRNVTIGCSSRRLSNIVDANGILGLSLGQSSELSNRLLKQVGGVFSYFISRTSTNRKSNNNQRKANMLIFGRSKMRNRRYNMAYTTLLSPNQDPTFFYVKIKSLLIQHVKLNVPNEVWTFDRDTGDGGVSIDTGTTFTYLPEPAFRAIRDFYTILLASYDNLNILESNQFCFNTTDADTDMDTNFDWSSVPKLTIEFEGGARLVPCMEGLFYEEERGVRCLGVRKGGDDVGSIIGSLFQRGVFWEFDLRKKRLGFARVD